jgi:hypothetical protein
MVNTACSCLLSRAVPLQCGRYQCWRCEPLQHHQRDPSCAPYTWCPLGCARHGCGSRVGVPGLDAPGWRVTHCGLRCVREGSSDTHGGLVCLYTLARTCSRSFFVMT